MLAYFLKSLGFGCAGSTPAPGTTLVLASICGSKSVAIRTKQAQIIELVVVTIDLEGGLRDNLPIN